MSNLEERIAALEAYEQIRQLPARYAQAVDSRDIDTLVGLFVDDVRVTKETSGRDALREWFDHVLRPFKVTFHIVGNHIIDLTSATTATGSVYCRPEHEVGDEWVTMPLQYWDRYERRDGVWLFKSRSIHAFYSADVLQRPNDLPNRFSFPGNPMLTASELPEAWPTWGTYWGDDAADAGTGA